MYYAIVTVINNIPHVLTFIKGIGYIWTRSPDNTVFGYVNSGFFDMHRRGYLNFKEGSGIGYLSGVSQDVIKDPVQSLIINKEYEFIVNVSSSLSSSSNKFTLILIDIGSGDEGESVIRNESGNGNAQVSRWMCSVANVDGCGQLKPVQESNSSDITFIYPQQVPFQTQRPVQGQQVPVQRPVQYPIQRPIQKKETKSVWINMPWIILGIIFFVVTLYLIVMIALNQTGRFVFNPKLQMENYNPPNMFSATGPITPLTPDEITARQNAINSVLNVNDQTKSESVA